MNDRQQKGAALVATMALASLVLPTVGHVLLEVRLESQLRANLGAQAQAFYTAEAGLASALAALAQRGNLDGVEHGPDSIAGTDDDGRLPTAEAALPFPREGFRFEATVARVDATSVEVTAQGFGPRQTRRELRTRVRLHAGRLVASGWRAIR